MFPPFLFLHFFSCLFLFCFCLCFFSFSLLFMFFTFGQVKSNARCGRSYPMLRKRRPKILSDPVCFSPTNTYTQFLGYTTLHRQTHRQYETSKIQNNCGTPLPKQTTQTPRALPRLRTSKKKRRKKEKKCIRKKKESL